MIQLDERSRRVENGQFWLCGVSGIWFTPEENCLIHSVLNRFLINCQLLIFGRFHIKSRVLPSLKKIRRFFKDSLKKSEDTVFLYGSNFPSNGKCLSFLHKPPFPSRAAALICITGQLLNSEEFSSPALVKDQVPRYGVEWIQGI